VQFKIDLAPLAQFLDYVVHFVTHLERLAKEASWDELLFCRKAIGVEDGPAAIIAHVCCELDTAIVGTDKCTMDSNNLATTLAYWQVVKSFGETDKRDVVDDSFGVKSTGDVGQLECDAVIVGFVVLVRKGCFENNCEKVYTFFADLELVKGRVGVVALSCSDVLLLIGCLVLHVFITIS